ncbi:hypothetical protein GCM10010260_28810 [Streptomyces filipinensis]|uniref:Uncharacterized protein n=1 Tax=Streptomyces filipinensis TaxID=66887 RepID=A0A918IA18_9ACTN|nr:hypothetical protein [Streptomyces filipinensis]GGU92389.1 hypothetical protein GCM10010260_28810 [Streptomyces filipinensis]
MPRAVTADPDDRPESRAAEWAAREAGLRGLPPRTVPVRQRTPEPLAQAPPLGAGVRQHGSEQVPRRPAGMLRTRRRLPAVKVIGSVLHHVTAPVAVVPHE